MSQEKHLLLKSNFCFLLGFCAMPPISSEVMSLGAFLCCGDSFIVPLYQRNYSWDEEQYELFWEDISKTFEGDAREYFLGSIVINKGEGPGLVVIDGQQRIITTSVLISALRCHLLRLGHEGLGKQLEEKFLLSASDGRALPSPRIVLNKHDRVFYERHIVITSSMLELEQLRNDDSLQPSNRFMAQCFCFMYRRLGEFLSSGWSIERLNNAVISALNEKNFIIRLDVRDDYDAFMLFETLNDRGLELSEADLLKNHLFARAGAFLDDVQNAWDFVEENLHNERVLKMVRHHWLSSRGQIGKRGLYADIKSEVRGPLQALSYASELSQASEYYAALRDAKHHIWSTFPAEEQSALRDHIEAAGVLRSDQLFVVLLAAIEVDPRNFVDLLKMMTCFTFRYTTICNMSSSRLTPVFINIAQHIRETGKVDVKSIFDLFLSKLYPSDSLFHSAFSRKTIRHNGLARYILGRLNSYLSPVQGGLTGTASPPTDLEHILPKRFSQEWTIQRKDFPGGPERYVHRLGNLTLVTPELNQKLGNSSFDVKRAAFARDRLRITDMVVEAGRWTAEEIKRRQNWMAGLAIKIWRCAPE